MKSSKRKQLNAQIYSEASDWLIEFRSGDIDAAGRKEFYDWLRTSPEHMRAYLELAAVWNEGAALDEHRVFDDTALMAAIAEQDNITSFPSRISDSSRSEPGHEGSGLSTMRLRAAAIAASLLIAAVGTWYWYAYVRNTYGTSVGEQRTLTLNDGSTIELDSGSKIRVTYSDRERQVELLDGQALFHVTQDLARPFIVHTKITNIRAIGTQFDVYKKTTGTTVTVVEGRVAVIPTSNPVFSQEERQVPAQPGEDSPRHMTAERTLGAGIGREDGLLLAAGEQATIDAQGALARAAQPNIAAATAWTQQQLVFKGTSLHEVADEFNRHNQRRLVVSDPQLAELKITGIFSSTNPAPLIRFLEARPDIAVTQTGNEIRVSRK
jgi:transmembrane sensor